MFIDQISPIWTYLSFWCAVVHTQTPEEGIEGPSDRAEHLHLHILSCLGRLQGTGTAWPHTRPWPPSCSPGSNKGPQQCAESGNYERCCNQCSRWSKAKNEVPLQNPLQLALLIFFSFCNCRISACLKHAWSVIFQGKYLKKAASRLLICCNFSFKEN